MSITVDSLLQNLNTYFGDSTTDRVSDAQRYQALTESTAWLLEELGNEHMIESVDIAYYDTVHNYKVTGILPDLLVGADLRRTVGLHTVSFARKSGREITEEIGQRSQDPSWATERIGTDTYMLINFDPQNSHQVIDTMDVVDGWVADTTGSDATNITVNYYERQEGAACLEFDILASQSANHYATIYRNSTTVDLSTYADEGSILFDFFIPDSTHVSSVTFTFGSGTSVTPATKANYWSQTISTDINGNALVDGWNTLMLNFHEANKTGNPVIASTSYLEIRVNYSSLQATDNGFKVDFIRAALPERLEFNYVSWNVGSVSAADPTKISAFTATTNVPFFSGSYDQYRYPVAHKAASILFYAVRLGIEAEREEVAAIKSLARLRKNFESSKIRESHTWKIAGVNLRRRNKLRKY